MAAAGTTGSLKAAYQIDKNQSPALVFIGILPIELRHGLMQLTQTIDTGVIKRRAFG